MMPLSTNERHDTSEISKSDQPESPFSLEQMMLQTKQSLVVLGHTLDKFATDVRVKNALSNLFTHDVGVTLILLNPYSEYSKAHEHFHVLESRSPAHEQILHTIRFLQGIFEDYNRPANFEVYLTNYMPRFRVTLIDEQICYVRLYMYGTDVNETPEFKLTKETHPSWFETIQGSVSQLLASDDVITLIKHRRFFESWSNTRAANVLNRCLETNCCKGHKNLWQTAETIILGYQNTNPEMAYDIGICNQDYQPGTFTIDRITPASQFLETPMPFSRWVNQVVDSELEAIQRQHPQWLHNYSQAQLREDVQKALSFCPARSKPLKQKIWYQEYSDIIHRLVLTFLVHSPDFELETYTHLKHQRRALMLDILDWLEENKKPRIEEWLHLTVATGLLGVDQKKSHAATSRIKTIRAIPLDRPREERAVAVRRIGEALWEAAHSPCRIDATDFFMDTMASIRHGFKIVSFPDDYLESIVLLKYYEVLLRRFPGLTIDCMPRSARCGNDATYEDMIQLLQDFPNLQHNNRFHVIDNGPKLGGVNLLKLHPKIMRLISEASVLDVRGARNFEMMQGINKETYFGFMVCREISESVTGLIAEDHPFIYIRQGPGERSFEGFQQRHERLVQGRMFATVTVNDHKEKWEGGRKIQVPLQQNIHKVRREILREFYSAKAPEFHSKFGGLLETEVKEFLDAFSGRVLVAGCGSGKEVEYLTNRGSSAFGFDFSPDAVDFAREEHPHLKGRFFVADLYNLDTIMSGKFDGIVANAVLVHLLDRDHLSLILKKMWDRLKENGLCFIRVIDKDKLDEEFDQNLFGEQRWFVYYSQSEIKKLAQQMGFSIEKMDRRTHTMYPHVHWISALLRKPMEAEQQEEQPDIEPITVAEPLKADETISILFLSADPSDAARLRLGEETREIQEKLRLARQRDQFVLHQRMANRPQDISQALLDIQPQIVHFSGHGLKDGALCFENSVGTAHPVKPKALAALFAQFSDLVNCVILNACYSEDQAAAIAKHIDYVIGMKTAIGDQAAIAFTIGFYQALGAGLTIEKAYDFGCIQIQLQDIPESETPILIRKEDTA